MEGKADNIFLIYLSQSNSHQHFVMIASKSLGKITVGFIPNLFFKFTGALNVSFFAAMEITDPKESLFRFLMKFSGIRFVKSDRRDGRAKRIRSSLSVSCNWKRL